MISSVPEALVTVWLVEASLGRGEGGRGNSLGMFLSCVDAGTCVTTSWGAQLCFGGSGTGVAGLWETEDPEAIRTLRVQKQQGRRVLT